MTGQRRTESRDPDPGSDTDSAGSASASRSDADAHEATSPSAARPFSIEAIRVRPLASRDLSAIAPLLTLAAASGLSTPPPVLRDESTSDDLPADDDPSALEHDEYWLAEYSRNGDSQIVGFALLHHVDRQRAAIRALWVDERHRRMGVGKRLLEGTVVHCQRAGYLKLVLELPFSLEKMVPLFGRLGFSFARRRAINGNTLLEFYLDLYREPGL